MKILTFVCVLCYAQLAIAQEKYKGHVILEGSFAQSIKGASSGYNLGVYYKTRFPAAIRAAYTQVFTGNDFHQYLVSYLQAGYFTLKDKWNYHLLLGYIPASRQYFLPVYTAGAGYLFSKHPKKYYNLVFQLNYAKNRIDEFFWAHLGVHIGFAKQK